jgi:putative ubiquitin-RnfH superfamily antitoxin RatB of RatAB toxin-antitoxin module
MADPAGLQVHVAYAHPTQEFIRPLRVAPGTTVGQAIELSGVLASFPEISLVTQPVGIYGKKKTLDTVLRDRDRIEIYRPLVADPKDSRRKRAAKKQGGPAAPAASGTPAA